MNPTKRSLQEVASSASALKQARSEPIQQENLNKPSGFLKSLIAPVQQGMNIEQMLEAQLEAEARKLEPKDPIIEIEEPITVNAQQDTLTDIKRLAGIR